MKSLIKIQKLPPLLDRKIYKTGQTRGADDDVIFQNRVCRNSTVLIPYQIWNDSFKYPDDVDVFDNGFIVLIAPSIYFESEDVDRILEKQNLALGVNCLVSYETRLHWDKYNPKQLGWSPAENRQAPLGGNYVARVPATTAANDGAKIVEGFTTTAGKGAGIRLYEYASTETIKNCRLQLEAIYWLCDDAIEAVCLNGMAEDMAITRKNSILQTCENAGLLDYDKLYQVRIINKSNQTVCPLCLDKLSGMGFFTRMAQAEGREVPDLTVTEINLFHINELRYGVFNHKPYNLAWGHHHCNVVTKDSGILATLKWMNQVLTRNKDGGFTL